MAETKFYTEKMREHCKAFFLENYERLDNELSVKYSKQYPHKYLSSNHNENNLFNFIANKLEEGIGSDYCVYNDKDLIDYRLNFLNSNTRQEKVDNTSYLDSIYVWYYFSPTDIPVKIRELIVDKFNLLEEFYFNCINSHVKRFYMRGHVKELWIQLDTLFANGFNKYLSQFNRFRPTNPQNIRTELLNYTEDGMYGLLRNADLYGKYIDAENRELDIQLIKFAFTKSPTNEPILFNFLISDLSLSPSQYLIDKSLLDQYINEQNEPLNILRESLGLPRIGEGWISETKLYYLLKDEFTDHVVIQHFKPKWLGRQHFDIYFPLLNIAVEYQGKQHFESVDYFGGKEALKQNIARDKRKKDKAMQNNCDLIYVEPGYDFTEVCSQIRDSKNFDKINDTPTKNKAH